MPWFRHYGLDPLAVLRVGLYDENCVNFFWATQRECTAYLTISIEFS